MLILPAATLAATANISIGGGTDTSLAQRAATPTEVSPGKVAGFYLWFRNDDAANLSTFFMKAFTDSTPVGAYWSRNGGAAQSCSTADGLVCTFGALNSGDEILITAGFVAKSSTANCKPADADLPPNSGGFRPSATETSYACVDFQFGSDSGFVVGKKKGNNSRGDAYHWYDYAATNTGADRGATFPFCDTNIDADCSDTSLTVANTAASRSNVQSTKVTAPNAAAVFNSQYHSTGLAVADNFAASCSDFGDKATCTEHETTGVNAFLGQWSSADVNSEQLFGNEFIRVDISMYGVNPNSVDGVVHAFQIGGAGEWFERSVETKCPDGNGPTDTTECFWVSGSGQTTTVSVWIHNNGKLRNF